MQAQQQQTAATCAAYPETPPRRVVLTVKQFAQRNPAFTELALRNIIFKASPRLAANGSTIPGNGLIESGALIRIGRKVLIDEDKFFAWVDKNGGQQ